MKPFPWKCGTCREKAVNPDVLLAYSQEILHDGRPYQVIVWNLDVFRCETCGAVMLDDTACVRLSDALRSAAGILSPAEIAAGRGAKGWAVADLAARLGVPEAKVGRLESGGQFQTREEDSAMREMFGLGKAVAT